jgi:proton glutamate symport protein
VAGVPRASLVVLAGTLSSFGLPLEGVAVILGVDELMDMARTSVNVVGNCLAAAVVGRWEGELGAIGTIAAPAPPHAGAAEPARHTGI